MREDGLHQVWRTPSWFDLHGGAVTSLDSFVINQTYGIPHILPDWDVPFEARPRVAVAKSGAFVTDGHNPGIREYDVDGRVLHILRIDERRRPVTKSIVAELLRDPHHRWTSRKIIDAIPKPDSLPAFQTLMVDDVGWLWAEVYGWDPSAPSEWIVFDPAGRARGSVRTPPGLELGETPSGVDLGEIGRDFILGVWRDSFDVEHVRRYALRRAGSPVQKDR